MILDYSLSERDSRPYSTPANLPQSAPRSDLSPLPNLIPRAVVEPRLATYHTAVTTIPTAGIVVLVVFLVIFILVAITFIILIRRRRAWRRQRFGLAPYPGGGNAGGQYTRGLVANAAPPAITVQRPSLNISRPISNPDQGPTPVFNLRKSAEYESETESARGSFEGGYNNGYSQAEQSRNQEAHYTSELPTHKSPQWPATPYDPHKPYGASGRSRSHSPSGSRSYSRSPSPPSYESEYNQGYGYGYESRSESRTSNRSNKNNAFAQAQHEESQPLQERNPDGEDSHRGRERARGPATYSFITHAVEAASSDDPAHYHPQPHQHHDSQPHANPFSDSRSYPHSYNNNNDLAQHDFAYAAAPVAAQTPTEISIGIGNPLDVPNSPFSPDGERAAKAAAAMGYRSEWYRSPPPEKGGFV